MNKVKILSITSIGLFAANILLIWFLVSHKPSRDRGEDPKKVIIEKLHLDEKQIGDYEKLIDSHRQDILNSEREMMRLKNQLYLTLRESENPSMTDSLIAEIGKSQINIEHINYRHFQDIRNLCRADQAESFNELSIDIAKLFSIQRMPPTGKK